MVNSFSVDIKRNSYGNIERVRQLSNGRVLYSVLDSNGNNAGKLSIPEEQVDVFESSYKEILKTAPKIQAYVSTNSSPEDIKKRRNLTRTIIGVSGIIGAGVPIIVLKNSTSITKKILGTVAGIVTGLAAGFVSSLGVTTPPGTLEFTKATRTLSKLDIKLEFDEKA